MQSVSLEISFQTLFNNEYEKLCRYALAYMQDKSLAEDVVQETFIRIWEQKKEVILADNAKYYLLTAVKNNCISALRKQKTAQVVYTDQSPEAEPEPFFYSGQQHEEVNDQRKKITEALNQLPPKCREVFLLVKLQNLSYKQAAELLNISIKTVENQMGKALRIFRDLAYVPSLTYLFIMLKFIITGVGVF